MMSAHPDLVGLIGLNAYHTPALLYMRRETYVTTTEAFHRGLSDVASPETPESETARRIVELAQMLGGAGADGDEPAARAAGGTAALASARELLDRAEAWRARAAASV